MSFALLRHCPYVSQVQEQANFGRCEGFCQNFPYLPETFLCDFAYKFAIIKTFFGINPKKDLHVFFCKRWAPFFLDFCPDFQGFVRIFGKSKLLGVRLHPHLLHHWYVYIVQQWQIRNRKTHVHFAKTLSEKNKKAGLFIQHFKVILSANKISMSLLWIIRLQKTIYCHAISCLAYTRNGINMCYQFARGFISVCLVGPLVAVLDFLAGRIRWSWMGTFVVWKALIKPQPSKEGLWNPGFFPQSVFPGTTQTNRVKSRMENERSFATVIDFMEIRSSFRLQKCRCKLSKVGPSCVIESWRSKNLKKKINVFRYSSLLRSVVFETVLSSQIMF